MIKSVLTKERSQIFKKISIHIKIILKKSLDWKIPQKKRSGGARPEYSTDWLV
jgi:hypothetical protein